MSHPIYVEAHLILRNPEALYAGAARQRETTTKGLHALLGAGWWLSVLDKEEGPDEIERKDDLILTTRAVPQAKFPDLFDVDALYVKIDAAVKIARDHRLIVLRYKVEDCAVDSKVNDIMGLLNPRPAL